ncbi:MAG TPA: sn-glycerol-3-phosphate ABC transporter ATP-binding protein UgpC [Pilimelia sp.]|nr:sn-glycerol-3-phosphate ABC transporter ATP-binding protein UgpC [Pilimelia sp.]
MADIVLDKVTKRYADGTEAVRDVSLEIADGEFVILVGPSGCGKSTTLNMIAGLEGISSGEIRIGGERVNDKAPRERDIAMVFQSYALYPHLTVRQNIAFPLTLAKRDSAEIDRRVAEVAGVLELTALLDRRPGQLSGGQRQRVAMGRAIVRNPKAFLMDEPLSNLDAKLRVQMRSVVARLQRRLGTTTVYVTHDQTEAMTLGDRVVVMRGGAVQQVGPPQELYDRPRNLFVAGFIGAPSMNFLPARLADGLLRTPLGDLPAPPAAGAAGGLPEELIVGLRPEHFEDAALVDDAAAARGVQWTAEVEHVESMGSDKYAYLRVEGARVDAADLAELAADLGAGELPDAGSRMVARLNAGSRVRPGEAARLWCDAGRLHLFDPDTGRNLTLPAE